MVPGGRGGRHREVIRGNTEAMMNFRRHLLWVDCGAAGVAGVAVLALRDWLERLHALPMGFILFLGIVNLLYASYSFSLALRPDRSMAQLKFLIFGNGVWAFACLAFAAHFLQQASVFGIIHLTFEAAFVGGLATLEWKAREQLVRAT